jgi:protein SCO1
MNRQSILFGSLALLFIAALFVTQTLMPPRMNGSAIDPPLAVDDFTLHSVDGPVLLSDFRGRYVILYFGYTSCPDICPDSLAKFREALSKQGERAGEVQVIFISVDPARDSVEYSDVYVKRFSPDFIGVTGSEAEIQSVTRQMGIFYQLNEPDDGGFYTVDHTASALILDREGRLILTWPYGLTPDQMEDDLRVLLRK